MALNNPLPNDSARKAIFPDDAWMQINLNALLRLFAVHATPAVPAVPAVPATLYPA